MKKNLLLMLLSLAFALNGSAVSVSDGLYDTNVANAFGQNKSGEEASEQIKEEQRELLNFPMFIEAGIGYMPRQNRVTTYTPTIKVGYEFVRRLSVYYVFDGALALDKRNGRQFDWSKSMGGGLAYRMFNLGKRDPITLAENCAFDIRAYVTSTYGNSYPKYTAYNLMLVNYGYRGKDWVRGSVYLGLGYRYIDSHTSGFKNTHNFCLELGFRF